jgi:drug/metabolite transporter (DMT)-like permease
MNYFLLFFSIFLETAKTVIANLFSKQELKEDRDIFKFNWIFYLGSFAILLCFPTTKPSLYTVLMAVGFAVVTTASQYFCLQALRCGPMSLTTFIQGSNLLIPTFFGMIFLNVVPSPIFWPLLVLLLVAMALVLISKPESVRFRWILLSMGTFLFTGGIGIMQTLAKPDEQIPFLQIAFALCALFNLAGQLLARKKDAPSFPIRSRTAVMAIGSGIAMGAVNRINLYLADPNVMPTYIFFPIVNGGLIFLTTVAAVIFFKERLTRKQWIGLVLGIAMLTVIGIV